MKGGAPIDVVLKVADEVSHPLDAKSFLVGFMLGREPQPLTEEKVERVARLFLRKEGRRGGRADDADH